MPPFFYPITIVTPFRMLVNYQRTLAKFRKIIYNFFEDRG